jgi:hypothetical protein
MLVVKNIHRTEEKGGDEVPRRQNMSDRACSQFHLCISDLVLCGTKERNKEPPLPRLGPLKKREGKKSMHACQKVLQFVVLFFSPLCATLLFLSLIHSFHPLNTKKTSLASMAHYFLEPKKARHYFYLFLIFLFEGGRGKAGEDELGGDSEELGAGGGGRRRGWAFGAILRAQGELTG